MFRTPYLQYREFIKPAFADNTQYVIIIAGRQVGKTFGGFQWILEMLMKNPGTSGLRVDTVQANLGKYIERYIKPILGDFIDSVHIDYKSYIITFMNGSVLDMGSAERPENLEGFGYEFFVLNEAGIILKKKGLRDNTIQPMVKGAIGKIIGTPKGKTQNGKPTKYKELVDLASRLNNYKVYHYTVYDSPEYTAEQIESIKTSVAPHIWLQEYMAQFVDVYENSMIASEDVRYFDYISLDNFDNLYMHADTTHTGKSTSDYFALGIMGQSKKDNNYYLIDYTLEKLDVEKQARKAIVMYSAFKDKVKRFTYDEKANQGFGFWIKKLAKDEYNLSLPIEPLKYPNDKISHFTPHVPHFKANRIYLPSTHKDITLLNEQLFAFPAKGVHDDAVDMLSGLLDNFNQTTPDFILDVI